MNAKAIADAAMTKELTPDRVERLKKLCQRMKVELADVVACLPAKEQVKFSA
jgi:hypothetical protein